MCHNARRVSRTWKIGIGLAVSAVALYVTLRHIALDDLARAVAAARVVWFLPALACFALMFATRARRWAVLLGGTPFWTTFFAMNIGYMMNNTLPLRVGEVGRAFIIGERTGLGTARALSSVIVERVIDLASVVLMFLLFAQLVPMPVAFARAAEIGAVVLVAGIGFGVVIVWKADVAERLLRPRLVALGPRGEAWWGRMRELLDGFRAVGSPRRLALVGVLTVAIWTLTILLAYFAMRAFLPPNATAAGLVVVSSNLGGALPSAPGGFGVIQGFAKMALVLPFHVPEDRALAYVFVWTLGQQMLLVALGLFALGRFGISLGQARRVASAEAPGPDASGVAP